MVEMLRPFNFSSFLELYQYLQKSALAGEKEIRMEHLERGKVTETLVLELEYIKARAFEEVYQRLPDKGNELFDSVLGLVSIHTGGRFAERAEKMLALLNNIPTRNP